MADQNRGGIFGIDLIPGVDIQDFLPKPVSDAIRTSVDQILGPGGPSIGDPQPPDRPIPVAAESKELNNAVKAIDAIVNTIEAVLKLSFLIPDQYELPLRQLVGALNTVRGWLD